MLGVEYIVYKRQYDSKSLREKRQAIIKIIFNYKLIAMKEKFTVIQETLT